MMLHDKEYSETELKAYIKSLEAENQAKDNIIKLAVNDLQKLTGWIDGYGNRNCLLKITCTDCPLYNPDKPKCEWRYYDKAKGAIKNV